VVEGDKEKTKEKRPSVQRHLFRCWILGVLCREGCRRRCCLSPGIEIRTIGCMKRKFQDGVDPFCFVFKKNLDSCTTSYFSFSRRIFSLQPAKSCFPPPEYSNITFHSLDHSHRDPYQCPFSPFQSRVFLFFLSFFRCCFIPHFPNHRSHSSTGFAFFVGNSSISPFASSTAEIGRFVP
jgi:hypothetical protein